MTMKEKQEKREVQDIRRTYTNDYQPPQMEKAEENLSEMTEIQMFSMDGQSQRAGNASRSSKASRPSFRNPYVDKSDPPKSTSANKSALKTNNTSGIKSSLYASNVKYSSGIKSYEQEIGDAGNRNEPIYPNIHKFEGQ